MDMRIRTSTPPAVLGSLGPAVFWLLVLTILLALPSEHARVAAGRRTLAPALGVLLAWRYGWQLVNMARSFYYGRFVFPRVRRQAAALRDSFPRRLYLVVLSSQETRATSTYCCGSVA